MGIALEEAKMLDNRQNAEDDWSAINTTAAR